MSATRDIPRELVDTDRYPLGDEAARGMIVAQARRGLAAEGCAILPGFVRTEVAARMAQEVRALVPIAHRRDIELRAYPGEPDATLPATDPRMRRHPFCMSVVAADEFPRDGLIMRLYGWDGLTELIAATLGESSLHRCADALLSCNATVMGDGDQHGWHFDSNDFVVTLLLQAPERGGRFVFAPGIRDDDRPNYAGVARAMDGDEDLLRVPAMAPGALVLFRGKRALHRVTPVEGSRQRIIAIFSYDRRPDMQFSDRTRLNAVGRTAPRIASSHPAGGTSP